MPAKHTTIAAAEKRVIKAEISSLNKAWRKVDSDHAKEHNRIAAEIRKLERVSIKIGKSCRRELSQISRRLAILQGRLNS